MVLKKALARAVFLAVDVKFMDASSAVVVVPRFVPMTTAMAP